MDKSVLKQAAEQTRTPFYLFDADTAAGRIKELKAALGVKVDICYAMKANPFLAGELYETADYLEVCSPGEFRICERAGVPMEKIVLSGVYKNSEDIRGMLEKYGEAGIYTAESLLQWKMLTGLAAGYGLKIHVMLRLTNGSQFGLDRSEILDLVAAGDEHAVIEGIQFFSGTQKKSATRIRRELQKLDTLLQELGEKYGFEPQKLEFGPGFPVDYYGETPDLEDTMTGILSEALASLSYRGRIVLELGREIAASCGSYVTSVVDTKRRGDSNFCIVDGGIHQLNYYGQMEAMKTPPLVHLDETDGEQVPWTVFGSLCTMNDVLVKEFPFSGLKTGSRLIFGKCGAYSVTEGIALFLSRDLPQVLMYSEAEGLKLMRARIETDEFNSQK